MAGFIPRHWRFGAVLSLVAFVFLPLSSAAASTDSYAELVVGPLTTPHGFKVNVTVACTKKGSYGQLVVTKSGRHSRLSYTYYPRPGHKTSCTRSQTMGSGSATLRWGGALSGKLKFGHAGSLKPIYYKGCTGPIGHYRKVKGTGNLKMSIHSRAFGRLVIHSAPAEMQEYTKDPTCTSSGSPTSYTTLYASWDGVKDGISAFRTANGHRGVSVVAQNNMTAVTGSMDDEFMGGSKLFSFKSDLSSAHVGSVSPLLTGGLTYTATSSCGTGYTTGTLKGKLVVHDPALGTLRFLGKKATKLYGGPTLESGSNCTTV